MRNCPTPGSGPGLIVAWIAAAMLMVSPATAPAADIGIDTAIPGAGLIHKRVISMRERRFLNLEQQRVDFSCGAATVATILKYAYGRQSSEQQVLLDMMKVSDEERVLREGFSLLDIKNYIESIGMQGIGVRLAPENLERLKVPAIVLLDIKGYKHFVVLRKRRGDRVYVGDPALGNRTMGIDDFVKSWNGIIFALVGNTFDANTILLRPPEPLSARRLLTDPAPGFNAPPLEFGFGYADLF